MPTRNMIIFEFLINGFIVTLNNPTGERFYDWLDENMWDFRIMLEVILNETIQAARIAE
jgi:hypothetical protein